MSGGAFDYAQYRIDDIIYRIEDEIERATCERPRLVTKQGVAVYEITGKDSKSYCFNYRFTCFESAIDYFTKCDRYQLLTGASREGETCVHFKEIFTGEVYEVKSYPTRNTSPTRMAKSLSSPITQKRPSRSSARVLTFSRRHKCMQIALIG